MDIDYVPAETVRAPKELQSEICLQSAIKLLIST